MSATKRGEVDVVVVALGGNALQSPAGDDSVSADFAHTKPTARHLVRLAVSGGYRLVVTHGNGPQVGNQLLRSEVAYEDAGTPLLPLEVCVADTQGGMGYMLQQGLMNAFHETGVPALVATVVTQVVVNPDDPEFQRPSKPVGRMISEDKKEMFETMGWSLVEDRHRGGWRRVVPSPDPQEIVEAGAIQAMVDDGVMVIAAGGGGVPVVSDKGVLTGVAAVVDKDLASSLLATDLKADALVILTDVDHAYIDFDSDAPKPLGETTVAEARQLMAEGQFPPGTMGPKIEAVCRFVERTGRPGIITSIERADDALTGRIGTRIVE
jgi:carbamate kinase